MAVCRVAEEEILIANVDGQYYAVSNLCSHRGQRLAEGTLRGFELTCPAHGARFDMRTGTVLGAPAEEGLKRYPVTVVAGKINVSVG